MTQAKAGLADMRATSSMQVHIDRLTEDSDRLTDALGF
jgi:hypothetical protein